MTEQATIGRGVIKVSGNIIFSDIDLDTTDTQGELRDKGVFEKIVTKLLLPAHYKIVGIYFQPWSTQVWHIVVESPDIPAPQENEALPEVRLTYHKEGNVVQLIGIQVT